MKKKNTNLSSNISWSISEGNTNCLEEGKIYRFLKHSNYETYKSSIDGNFRDIIESNGGHLCIICPNYNGSTTYYTISSRVFKGFFYNEIGDILNLLKTQCSTCNKLKKFKKNNKSFDNLYKKFGSSNQITERSGIFLINKDKYINEKGKNLLEFESYINLERPNIISGESIKEYIKDNVAKFEYQIEVPKEEKYLIAAQIKTILYEQEKNGVQSINTGILKTILDSWINALD